MENVRIAVLNAYDSVLTYIDNSIINAMHYFDEELHTYLEGSAYTFTFSIYSDHDDASFLSVGNKVSFLYKDKGYYCNIVNVEVNETKVKVTSYGLSLELTNEEIGAFTGSSLSFEQYIEKFNFENAVITIGVNEVSDKRISNEWTGTETVLARLFSLANVFDAELEFITELNDDYSLKQITMNVYRAHSDNYQGMGHDRTSEVIRYGKEIKGITKTSDITELYTAIRPTGTDGLTLAGISRTEYDADGNIEYYSTSGTIEILAPQARDRFPSTLLYSENDRYIAKVWSYETENVNTLYGQALAQLKKYSVPKSSYDVDGYIEADIGDTFTIEDSEYNPILYLEARVVEQVICFTDKTQCKTTFDNFTVVDAQISQDLISQMNALVEANKMYQATIVSDNGILLKNSTDSTTLTALVKNGVEDVTNTLTINWYKDNVSLGTLKAVAVYASDVEDKSVYRFEAIDSNNRVRGTAEVTVMLLEAIDGQTSYIHIAYANSADGTVDFSTSDSTGKTYLGQYVDFNRLDSEDPSDYQWSKIKGETGEKGDKGDKGDTGATGVGISNVIEYYQVSTSNTTAPTSWSTSVPTMTTTNKYLWNYEETTYSDGSTKETAKRVIGVYGNTGSTGSKGDKGDTGEAGATGNGISSITNYYLTTSSSSGVTTSTSGWSKTPTATNTTNKYLWNYEEITYTNGNSVNTTPHIIGTHGATGATGAKGDKGDKGDTGDDGTVMSDTAPEDTTKLWYDTTDNLLKKYDSENGTWEVVNDYAGDLNDMKQQITTEYNSAISKLQDSITLMVSSLTETTDINTQAITNLSSQIAQNVSDITLITTSINEVNNLLTGVTTKEEISQWARFQDGILELGSSDSPFAVKLSQTELGFYQNGTRIAYLSNQQLNISQAVVMEKIQLPHFSIEEIVIDGVYHLVIH